MDEIISTLLVPTERPPLGLDIKRALLTFDQVNITAPDDRELIEPASFMSTLLPFPIPIAIGGDGPVLPLGKLPGYDEQFEGALRECDAAVRQGSVVVRGAPQLMKTGFAIGNFPNPEGWAPPQWVMGTFRSLVSRRDVLLAACKGLPSEARLRQLDLGSIAPGGLALQQGGGGPAMADLNDGSLSPDIASAVQRMAATRVGTLIKCIGLCENAGLHPSSSDTGMVALLEHFQKASASALTLALEGHQDHDLVRRAMRVERVVFAHESPDSVLSTLSVDDVLRLRTKAWGRAASARTAFFANVRRLAEEAPDDKDFDGAVRKAIDEYNTDRRDLADEWKRLGGKVGVPVLLGALAAPGNVLQSALGMPTWGVVVGVIAAGTALTRAINEVVAIFRKRKDMSTGPGKALVMPYAFALRE